MKQRLLNWGKVLFTALVLSACSTKVEKVAQQDFMQAFLISQDQKLYVVGMDYDYQFSGGKVDKLQQFLQSPLTSRIEKAEINFEIHDGKNVRGYYDVILAKTLSEKEKQQASALGFKEYKEKNILFFQRFYAYGVLAKLENHEELLAKHKMSHQMPIALTFYEKSQQITGEDALKVVFLPVYVAVGVVGGVLSIPIWAMVAVGEATH